jgi:hypothetical protein
MHSRREINVEVHNEPLCSTKQLTWMTCTVWFGRFGLEGLVWNWNLLISLCGAVFEQPF